MKLCLQIFLASLLILLVGWLTLNTVRLQAAATGPVDAIFVLGGSIRREIYAAELAQRHPEIPVLISQGSPDPCILLIFQQAQVPLQQVWLEKCADSTFSNFYFGISILRQWQVRKLKLVTSPTHLPRSQWLAQILLGAHGIWVEPALVQEQGVPGNRESWLKTGVDVLRSLLWAPASQVYSPSCSKLIPLPAVDFKDWQNRGFHCEHQGGLN